MFAGCGWWFFADCGCFADVGWTTFVDCKEIADSGCGCFADVGYFADCELWIFGGYRIICRLQNNVGG